MKKLWVDTYKPKAVSDYVFSDENQRNIINKWIEEKDLPHLALFGSAGIGKTALANLLVSELGIHDYDYLPINASRFTSIEDIRNKVIGFIQILPFASPFKVILLDECLDENTPVVVLRDGIEQLIPIKDVNDSTDLVKSFNVELNRIEWKSFQLFDKGIQDALEIEFANGETVICTADHKWYVEIDGEPVVVKASELSDYMHILTT